MTNIETDTDAKFWAKVDKTDTCWVWTGATNMGYGQFTTESHPKRVRVPAQAYSFEIAGGVLEPGQRVMQTCGNKLCVHPAHLSAGTQADYDRWSPENTAKRFWARVSQQVEGCWEWQGRRMAKSPYGQTTYKSKPINAHRLAWILTHGAIPEGLVICHRCDNPPCCRPDHLFTGTHAENTADMIAKQRNHTPPSGITHPAARFSADQVRALRARYDAGGVSTHELADEYGASSMAVWRVVTRKSYLDVE
ncbi:MAG: HNH endonuclease signature motif containing protein [Hyphomicrobium sp.]|jgi:hypothetical protein